MSVKETPTRPIRSDKIISDLSNDLRKTQEAYYLIFHIILETGIPLRRLLQMKVSDLYKKQKLSYESRHHATTYSVSLSLRLQRELAEFFKGRKGDEAAFTGSRTNKAMYVTAFQKALNASSERLGISPPANATTLRKTFLHRIVMSDGNYIRAAHFTDASGPAEVIAYLGIESPDEISLAKASKDLDKAMQRGALPKLKTQVLEIFEDLDALSKKKDDRTLDETLKGLAKIEALTDLVSRFQD